MDRGRTKAGARVGTSSTANAVPLLLQGEGLNAAPRGEWVLERRAPLTPLSTLHSPLSTLSLSTTSSLLHRIFANIDYNIETKKVYFFGEAK